MNIAISQQLIINEHGVLQETIDSAWGRFISKTKITPVFIPAYFDFEKLSFEGVILTGGGDLYGISQKSEDKIRDELEIRLIAYCLKKGIPIYGVCRGMQIINNFFGGTLKKIDGHIGSHSLSDSRIVNSYHNYAIDKLGHDLQIVGKCDSVIEEIRYKNIIFAQMHHPERRISEYDIEFMCDFFHVK